MSIYTKIFATASIFAIAASALISPSVSAGTTGVEITGYTNSTTTDSLCIRQAGTTAPATTVVSGVYPTSGSSVLSVTLPVAPTISGTSYDLYKVAGTASNSCAVLTGTAVVSNFKVFSNHTTLINGTTVTVRDQLPGISSTNGSNVVNFCLGKTDAVTVTITDLDGDLFTSAPAPTANTGLIYSAATINGSTVSYTVQPTLAASQTLGTIGGAVTFAAPVYQYALTPAVDSAIYPTPVTALTFNVSNSCAVNTPVSSVVASSSVTASSTAATTSSTAASAMAAKSSTTATVEVDAPSVGKGSATVRTGGAY